MSEYPEDIMEKALGITASAFLQKHEDLARKVASAILAERERSASTARRWAETCRRAGQAEGADVADDIAKCIAEGK